MSSRDTPVVSFGQVRTAIDMFMPCGSPEIDGSNATVARGKNMKEDGDVFLTTEQGSIHMLTGSR